jgi:p-aminobenzoyl-glutamate transporter AbgT
MLYLAVEYTGNKLNSINIIGLVICLIGIVFHCILKFYTLQSIIKKNEVNFFSMNMICFFFIEEKPLNVDPVVTERLLSRRLESVDEWSLDDDLNSRRTSLND